MPRLRTGCVVVLTTCCLLAACRHAPIAAPLPTPDAPVSSELAVAEPGSSGRRAPTGSADVVAGVGGEPITRRDLARASYERTPNEALHHLVELALLRRAAEAKKVHLTEEEIDAAMSEFAASYFCATEQLRGRVEAAGISWPVYLEDVKSQMLESRLLRSPARPGPKAGKDAWLAAWNHERRVALACQRAETTIEIEDPELQLPDELVAARVDIDGVHVSGDAGSGTSTSISRRFLRRGASKRPPCETG